MKVQLAQNEKSIGNYLPYPFYHTNTLQPAEIDHLLMQTGWPSTGKNMQSGQI